MPSERGEQALAALRRDDPTALDQLVVLYGPGLLYHLQRRVRDIALAEDLFQEVWTRVIERRHQLRDPSRFVGWLYRIAGNLAANAARRMGRETSLEEAVPHDPAGDPDTDPEQRLPDLTSPGARESAHRASVRRRLQVLLNDLDDTTREMITLRFYHGLTTGQIAEALSAPIGTVCSTVHRGLIRLRQACREAGLEPGDLL